MTVEQYWQQIVLACFLDEDDPIGRWKLVFDQIYSIQSILNEMPIEKFMSALKAQNLRLVWGENVNGWVEVKKYTQFRDLHLSGLAPGGRYYLLISLFIVMAT